MLYLDGFLNHGCDSDGRPSVSGRLSVRWVTMIRRDLVGAVQAWMCWTMRWTTSTRGLCRKSGFTSTYRSLRPPLPSPNTGWLLLLHYRLFISVICEFDECRNHVVHNLRSFFVIELSFLLWIISLHGQLTQSKIADNRRYHFSFYQK